MKNILPILIPFCALLFTACGSKDTPSPADVIPKISIASSEIAETNSSLQLSFKVSLDKKTDKTVTVTYTTLDNTALAGSDYVAKTGTLTIPAQNTEGAFEITILGDSLREVQEFFYIELSNPVNAEIQNTRTSGVINNDDYFVPTSNEGYSTPASYAGYTLDFADEFSKPDIDETVWGYDQGGNGWGNQELQNYTNRKDNSFISDGRLIIEATNERLGNNNYTSARMLSKGKKDFQFGRIDIRAKVPTGKGIWPALWGLGSNISQNNWPACGEIDIMEVIGKEPNNLYGTAHWGNVGASATSKGGKYTLPSGGFSDKFHVFTIIWQQDAIEWLVDDVSFHKIAKTDVAPANYPFNNKFFLIMNVAVGGSWPGPPDATTVFPQRMFVDYVRVFKKM
jgi:beta-glucanase (GH16 family)